MPSFLEGFSIIQIGMMASIAAGLATGVGGIPILFTTKVSERTRDILLGFAAGVMLAATSFSLIIPAIEYGGGGVSGVAVVVVGMLVGAIFLDVIDKLSPHQHFIKGPEGAHNPRLAAIWLFIIAITIHNFPEGLAVGVGFGGGDVGNGIALAIGIGLQNIPEGLAVALALVGEKYSRGTAFLAALLTGLVEPLGGFLGLYLVQLMQGILPYGLAFAAGAMLFVISDEIIPETHRTGFERAATYAVVIGFLVMMLLDSTLG
ncbi:MAG: ZIP family metal transporter [Chloroflexota bacterium]|jgi:ZIP family zinc transporter